MEATNSKLLALMIAAPGTILHEAAHYLACLLLNIPAGRRVTMPDGSRGRVDFFRPREDEETGGMILGSVPHAKADPFRGALIAIAPVLLVPPFLVGISLLMFGGPWSELDQSFLDASLWKQVIWLYLAISCGQAAFPSPGDHIGVLGGISLIIAAGLWGFLTYSSGGIDKLSSQLEVVVLILAIPSIAAALMMVGFRAIVMRRRS